MKTSIINYPLLFKLHEPAHLEDILFNFMSFRYGRGSLSKPVQYNFVDVARHNIALINTVFRNPSIHAVTTFPRYRSSILSTFHVWQ